MRVTQSLRHAARLIAFSGAFLCALLVCVAFLSAASLRKSAEPRHEPAYFASGQADCDQLRKTVQQLTAELDQFKRRAPGLDKHGQIDYLRDLIMKEEQRAEALQAQIQDATQKEAPLQTRIDQLDDQLRPDNIDQALAGVGSMRPEEAKEALRRRLGNEKRRIETQLDLLHQSEARLKASLATADASIQRLRLRLAEATRS
jgi:chromosome segregation ATPase